MKPSIKIRKNPDGTFTGVASSKLVMNLAYECKTKQEALKNLKLGLFAELEDAQDILKETKELLTLCKNYFKNI